MTVPKGRQAQAGEVSADRRAAGRLNLGRDRWTRTPKRIRLGGAVGGGGAGRGPAATARRPAPRTPRQRTTTLRPTENAQAPRRQAEVGRRGGPVRRRRDRPVTLSRRSMARRMMRDRAAPGRRRRKRRRGSLAEGDQQTPDDPPNTVVHVRPPRSARAGRFRALQRCPVGPWLNPAGGEAAAAPCGRPAIRSAASAGQYRVRVPRPA